MRAVERLAPGIDVRLERPQRRAAAAQERELVHDDALLQPATRIGKVFEQRLVLRPQPGEISTQLFLVPCLQAPTLVVNSLPLRIWHERRSVPSPWSIHLIAIKPFSIITRV